MSLYLDLLAAPQFDRSLVAYTVGNFQRIKDLLVRASGRVAIMNLYGTGPYPVSFTYATPFKSDVLVNAVVSGFLPITGLSGVNSNLDGASTGVGTMTFYFNSINTHQAWGAAWTVRGQTSGNHTWQFTAGPALGSDSNDKIYVSLMFVEVT